MGTIESRIREVVGQLVDQLATQIAEQVIPLARDAARDQLLEMVARIDVPAPPKLGGPAPKLIAGGSFDVPPVKPARPRLEIVKERAPKQAPPINANTTKGKPRQRAIMKCKKCGAPGFRADGCGTSHPPMDKPTSDDDSEGSRVSETREAASAAVTFRADMEPSTAPTIITPPPIADHEQTGEDHHHANVRAHRTALSHEDVYARAEIDRREVCPVHGWCGVLAFHRERHDLCEVQAEVLEEPIAIERVRPVASPDHVLKPKAYGERSRTKRSAPRAVTLAVKNITRAVLRDGAREVELAGPPVDDKRPTTRGECRDGPRPCPWVTCKHHLYLDVDPETGSIKFNFPDVEPEDLIESCSLDIAERGGVILEDIGNLLNITRERIRQVETRALIQMKQRATEADLEVGIDSSSPDPFEDWPSAFAGSDIESV